MIVRDGIEYRNLVEQVQKNKEDIARHYEIDRVLADWGIKVIGRLDTWEIPTGSFEYGDAYAVGPEGGPFDFYIYTRGTPDYWLNYGPISIVGPQGPQGEPGQRGEQGKSSKWYVGQNEPTGNIQPNDMWLKVNNNGTTNGFVYTYQNNAWALTTSILGPQGPRGQQGATGPQGPTGAQGPQGPAGNPSPVIDIIAELPEGSVISDTYDPANVPSNSGVLMPVSGVNHLWIIINGMWTDSGSWGQGGTKVYENGVEKTEVNLNNYVKFPGSSNSVDRVLGLTKNTTNTLKMFNVADPSTNNTMVNDNITRYGASNDGTQQPGGYLVCHNPANSWHAATKQYVDNAISAAHGEIQHATFAWDTEHDIVTFSIDLGVYANEIASAGSLTGWGGSLIFEGTTGYVYVSNAWHYNGQAIITLEIRADADEANLRSFYFGSNQAQDMATFTISGFELNGTIGTFTLALGQGLPGGAFVFNSIPNITW